MSECLSFTKKETGRDFQPVAMVTEVYSPSLCVTGTKSRVREQ